MRAARVGITTTAGATLAAFAPYRRGDPEAPLSDAELGDKFDELAGPVIGRVRAAELRDLLWRLDRLDLSALRLAAA